MPRYALVIALFACAVCGRGMAQPPQDDLGKRTAEAVERGLKFLASAQEKDGSWTPRANTRSPEPAVTALAVRAFISAGHVPGQGRHGEVIDKGIRAVLKAQQENGLFNNPRSGNLEMYHHGICTLMLAEVAGKVKGDLAGDIKKALDKAVRVILQGQRKQGGVSQGGWRYRVMGTDADMSVTGWQVAALRAAKDAGCDVPAETFERALAFVKRTRNAQSGGYTYTVGGPVTVSCTATAILCMAACGEKVKELDEAQLAAAYILRSPPPTGSHVFYSYYHGARATFLLGGKYWASYREHQFDPLLKMQKASGSWESNDGNGPSYGTAMAILALSVETPLRPKDKPPEKPEGK